jgi:hypothetical protein
MKVTYKLTAKIKQHKPEQSLPDGGLGPGILGECELTYTLDDLPKRNAPRRPHLMKRRRQVGRIAQAIGVAQEKFLKELVEVEVEIVG